MARPGQRHTEVTRRRRGGDHYSSNCIWLTVLDLKIIPVASRRIGRDACDHTKRANRFLDADWSDIGHKTRHLYQRDLKRGRRLNTKAARRPPLCFYRIIRDPQNRHSLCWRCQPPPYLVENGRASKKRGQNRLTPAPDRRTGRNRTNWSLPTVHCRVNQ